VDHGQYLFVLAGCVLLTLPLEFLGARVYRRPARWAGAVLPVALVFAVWDALAIRGGVWNYDPRYLTGVLLPGAIPLEELLFFLVVPTCGLLTFGCVRAMLGRAPDRAPARRRETPVAAVMGLGYTVPAVAAVLVVGAAELAVLRTGLFRRLEYWLSMVIVVIFQVPVDGWLTKLSAPIVRYAPGPFLGVRWPWDIPVEDFAFGFALVTAVLLLWVRAEQREGERV
jgi:lycopene cyclase domain-containing protein